MADPKLHPEVKVALTKGPQCVAIGEKVRRVETPTMFATRIALLAAEKAREAGMRRAIEIARDGLIGTGPQDHPEDRKYDKGIQDAIKAIEEAIRRGTP